MAEPVLSVTDCRDVFRELFDRFRGLCGRTEPVLNLQELADAARVEAYLGALVGSLERRCPPEGPGGPESGRASTPAQHVAGPALDALDPPEPRRDAFETFSLAARVAGPRRRPSFGHLQRLLREATR